MKRLLLLTLLIFAPIAYIYAEPRLYDIQSKTITLLSSDKISAPQCKGIAKSTGARCKLRTKSSNGFCHHHQSQSSKSLTTKKATPIVKQSTSSQCLGTAKSTRVRCKLKTKSTSGYCHHHD